VPFPLKGVGNALVRHWKVVAVLVVVGAVVGLLAYGFTTDPRAIPSTMVGKPAPEFSLTLFDGRTVRLSDFRGKVVFLNFWASWCPPCRDEAPLIEAAWRRYQTQGVVFLGVDIQDTEEAARAFLQEFRISYMNGRDARNRIAIDYGVYGIPETYFIDPGGRITAKYVGALEATILAERLTEAAQGIVSIEGKSRDHQSISVR
jgi:cytochrome c biogenesis protein CcmG/thiol:disulfide interchange protein DsbE